jgi:hypothetical protein
MPIRFLKLFRESYRVALVRQGNIGCSIHLRRVRPRIGRGRVGCAGKQGNQEPQPAEQKPRK